MDLDFDEFLKGDCGESTNLTQKNGSNGFAVI